MNSIITNPYIRDRPLFDYGHSFDNPHIDMSYINDYFNVVEKLEDPLKPDLKKYPTIKTVLESEWIKTHPFYEKFPRNLHYCLIKHYYLTHNNKAKNPKYKLDNERQHKIIMQSEEEGRKAFMKMMERQDRKKQREQHNSILESLGIPYDKTNGHNQKKKDKKHKKKNK